MKQLDVFMGDTLAGYLREREDGGLTFAYDDGWITTGNAALAPALPVCRQEHSGESVVAYFDNLLPEGAIRDFIARALHISPNNVFGLLERFGGDTAGALSLLPQGLIPTPHPRYLPISTEEIRSCFAASRGIPLHITGEPARVSLSGAQDKMTVFVDAKGDMAIPLGDAPSSHIIKPSMPFRQDIPDTAINEAFIMNLAKEIELDVAETRYLPDLDAVLVSRYDREFGADGQLRRLHQNDLCQIMSVPSSRKYESEGGPSLKECFFAVEEHSSQPALDKRRMIEWVIFNLATGNMDSHPKNVSLLASKGRVRLAPFYDLLCTSVYPNLTRRFAFKVGGENRPEWIRERHWERFNGDIGVRPQLIRRIRSDVCGRIEHALPQVADSLRAVAQHANGLAMIDRIEAEVMRSLRQTQA